MVGCAAITPVMFVVGYHMGVDTGLLQSLKRREIEGLYRTPAAMKEIVTASVEFTPGRHTRHAANVEIIKLYRFVCQPGKVRGDGIAPIGGEMVTRQRIKH